MDQPRLPIEDYEDPMKSSYDEDFMFGCRKGFSCENRKSSGFLDAGWDYLGL